MEMTGLSRDSIYRLGHTGTFPRPIKLGARASGWVENEVETAIAQRMQARDAEHGD